MRSTTLTEDVAVGNSREERGSGGRRGKGAGRGRGWGEVQKSRYSLNSSSTNNTSLKVIRKAGHRALTCSVSCAVVVNDHM